MRQVEVGGPFPQRSSELNGPIRSQRTGKACGTVITGLALLGAKAPAIRTLDDVIALNSEHDQPMRQARGADGNIHTLPLERADLMEAALAGSPVSEEAHDDER